MAVSILTYTREVTINDGYDLLVKLEEVASALGWTTDIQHDVLWEDQGGGVYGWSAGTGDYLEIKSAGYGAQNLVYRFWWTVTASGTRGDLYYSLIDPNNPTYSTASSANPYLQNRINTDSQWYKTSVPDGAFTDGAYFFGNERFIVVICGLYADALSAFAVGIPDLLPEFFTEPDISFLFPAQNFLLNNSTYYWDSLKSNPTVWKGPFGYLDQSTVYNRYQATVGCGPSSGGVAASVFTNQNVLPSGDFAQLRYLVRYNAFSDKRIGAQPTIFLKDSVTGQWYPCGVLPVLLLPYSGLALGGEITYGADTYRAFPNTLQSYNYGMAFRTS